MYVMNSQGSEEVDNYTCYARVCNNYKHNLNVPSYSDSIYNYNKPVQINGLNRLLCTKSSIQRYRSLDSLNRFNVSGEITV